MFSDSFGSCRRSRSADRWEVSKQKSGKTRDGNGGYGCRNGGTRGGDGLTRASERGGDEMKGERQHFTTFPCAPAEK